MAALPDPWRNIEDFARSLEEIRAGAYEDYAFYCALLFTGEAGLGRKLAEWVDENWWALDRQTGDHTLVFMVSDARPTGEDRRTFRPEDVYDIARAFGVKPRALPCCVCFLDPDDSKETVVVRLDRFIPERQAPEDIVRGMRGLASALEECSRRDRAERIDCLRAELVETYYDIDPARRSDALDEAEKVAQASDAVARTVANGATVAGALVSSLRLLGIGI